MRELEDEGKVMALADFACPVEDSKNPLMDFFTVEGLNIKAKYPTSGMYRKLKNIFSSRFEFSLILSNIFMKYFFNLCKLILLRLCNYTFDIVNYKIAMIIKISELALLYIN